MPSLLFASVPSIECVLMKGFLLPPKSCFVATCDEAKRACPPPLCLFLAAFGNLHWNWGVGGLEIFLFTGAKPKILLEQETSSHRRLLNAV